MSAWWKRSTRCTFDCRSDPRGLVEPRCGTRSFGCGARMPMTQEDRQEPKRSHPVGEPGVLVILGPLGREGFNGRAGTDGVEDQKDQDEAAEEIAICVAQAMIAFQPGFPGGNAFNVRLDM